LLLFFAFLRAIVTGQRLWRYSDSTIQFNMCTMLLCANVFHVSCTVFNCLL